ncbi:MAG: hypothetical protein LBJ12_02930 [Oscillospiraceae bacterium]|jgi:hypothetical protein|nr:hypothetical protein [Oscillospiraceae bacterium]
MKRILISFAALFVVFAAFTACNNTATNGQTEPSQLTSNQLSETEQKNYSIPSTNATTTVVLVTTSSQFLQIDTNVMKEVQMGSKSKILLDILKKKDIKLKTEGADENGRFYSGGNSDDYSYLTDSMRFAFDLDSEELIKIVVFEGALKTNLGIGIGDEKEKVISIYNNPTTVFGSAIEYFDGKNYLTFNFADGVVDTWIVSKRSQNNLNAIQGGIE